MQEFQKRVVIEKDELDQKRQKLAEFISGSVFDALPEEEKQRLQRQASIMFDYSTVLGERISAF